MPIKNSTVCVITQALLQHRFKDDIQSLREDARALAHDIVQSRLSDEEKQLMAVVPQSWLCAISGIHVEAPYVRVKLGFGMNLRVEHMALGKVETLLTPISVAGTWSSQPSIIIGGNPGDDTLIERTTRISDRLTQLESAIKTARAKTSGTIGQFTTVKKLIEGWPEIEPFARPYLEAKTRIQLPAVQLTEMNSLLDLPVEDSKVA